MLQIRKNVVSDCTCRACIRSLLLHAKLNKAVADNINKFCNVHLQVIVKTLAQMKTYDLYHNLEVSNLLKNNEQIRHGLHNTMKASFHVSLFTMKICFDDTDIDYMQKCMFRTVNLKTHFSQLKFWLNLPSLFLINFTLLSCILKKIM